MACAEWFNGFIKRHMARCPREDWPNARTPEELAKMRVFFDAWRHALDGRGIEERFAEDASLAMAADPPAYLADHLRTILRLSAESRAKALVIPAVVAVPDEEEDTPERAEALAALKAMLGSLAASKRAGAPFVPSRPRTPQGGDARAVPGRPYLADAPGDDPVLARERGIEAKPVPARPEDIRIPEDDLEPLF
jgi:hypothetical protein